MRPVNRNLRRISIIHDVQADGMRFTARSTKQKAVSWPRSNTTRTCGVRTMARRDSTACFSGRFFAGGNSHAGPPERPATSVRSGDRTAWVQLARVCHYLPITMCFGQETRPSALAAAARATNGQATAAPPSAAINSRLLTGMTLSVRGLPGKHTTA